MKANLANGGLIGVLLSIGITAEATSDAAAQDRQAAVFRLPTLPARAFDDLRHDVVKARVDDPRSFTTVSALVTYAPEANARARGRKAPIALYLARLGSPAVLPMLEMLALDAPHGLPDEAAPALRRDLIEAVGRLRDPRGLTVLSAILDDPSEDADTTRTVTEAIARIGTDEAATQLLAALDGSSGERAYALISGMGECRRLRVTEALARELRTTPDEARARAASLSLGRAGNAWVWKTVADRSEELRIRETAARALVDAFTHREGETREAAAKALLVVDAPETLALITDAKTGASSSAQRALDVLAKRVSNNPTRRR